MKRVFILFFIMLYGLSFSQSESGIYGDYNWVANWTNFKSKATEYKSPTIILAGEITENRTLKRNQTYLLTGKVYVVNKAILEIEAGTIIRGDFDSNAALIITKGAKLIANGEENDPIVFTSSKKENERKPGDWAGIVIMGEAPSNKFTGTLNQDLNPKYNAYGGSTISSCSGVLKYVRIEFAGSKTKNNETLSALTLAGVGNATKIENVQVSNSKGDAYKFCGGNIVANKLIAIKSACNDFNFTEGVQASLENSLSIRCPFVSAQGAPKVFEITNYEDFKNSDLSKPVTKVKINFSTAIRLSEKEKGYLDAVAYIDTQSMAEITNSVFSGFEKGCVFSDKIDFSKYKFGNLIFRNNILNACDKNFVTDKLENFDQVNDLYLKESNNIKILALDPVALFYSTDFKSAPDLRVKLQSNALAGK